MREITPDVKYLETGTDQKPDSNGSDLSVYLNMLEKGELDILVCDASLIPLALNPELKIAAVLDRSNPFNVFISESVSIFEDYSGEMPIDVFSPVIKGQLIYHHPTYKYVDCERDFSICYQRMLNDECGGFVLPAFLVETLNQQGRVVEVFNSSVCMPPPGQGAIALVTRKSDRRTGKVAGKLNNRNVYLAVTLERKFAEKVMGRGNCVGALCSVSGAFLDFSAVIVNPDGSERIERTVSGDTDEGMDIIRKLIDRIYSAGTEASFA